MIYMVFYRFMKVFQNQKIMISLYFLYFSRDRGIARVRLRPRPGRSAGPPWQPLGGGETATSAAAARRRAAPIPAPAPVDGIN